MRFVTARHGDNQFAAMLDGDRVVPLRDIRELGRHTPRSLLTDPPLVIRAAIPVEEVQLLPPIPNPQKIVCVGLNYGGHIRETGRELPSYPVLFAKFASALIGPADAIALPPESQQVDFEGELAVVIGGRARRISPDRALDVVGGYCVANDVTMRDYQYKTHQWLQGKTWDASTPLGPALVTADEIGDGSDLDIEVLLNGELMQSASTSELIFSVPRLVSMVSEFTELHPGDIILTGTPGGVGYRRDPQVFLEDGDVISVAVSGVGKVENQAVSPAPISRGNDLSNKTAEEA